MNYLFSIAFLAFLFSCSEPAASKQQSIARDTTIQPGNAFTNLHLDSTLVAGFLSENTPDDSLKNKVTGFYNARNYQYAWFTEDGLSEAGEAFWNIHQQQEQSRNDSNGHLHSLMQRLLNEDDEPLTADSVGWVELSLTLHFFTYVKKAFNGTVDPADMQWHIPKRRLNSTALPDSFLADNGNRLKPLNKSFYLLQEKVKQYGEIAKQGGWPSVHMENKSLKKGQRSDAVVELKKRLRMTGEFVDDDTSRSFTVALAAAVTKAEHGFGMKEDGIATKELIATLNVSAEERLQQLLINLERMRWLPAWPVNRIVANIPEYRLHVFENDREVLGMKIVVGKAANRTVIFSDELQYVVFSPYWNVPRSIVRREIVPAMNRSSSYISRNNMEITGYSNGLPVVRQKPGPTNALGRVKFIFPNRYNIYFHDTPAKTLFDRQSRAFSHGCVRLQQPFKLAQYLLRNDSSWTDEKIRQAMNSNDEKWVKLPTPVPVYLLYLTAWVDKDGQLNFRDDIYEHDKQMSERLFTTAKDDKQ